MTEERHTSSLAFDAADEYRPEPLPAPEVASWKDGSIRIGIHTSIAGDIAGALDIAHGLGANALQIFSSSPRMWDRGTSRISEADAERFRARRKDLGLGPLVIHANYLINLASPNPILRARSIQGFHQEIVRALALGADYLVIHPGSAPRVEAHATQQGTLPGVGARPAEEAGTGSCTAAVAAIAASLKQSVRGVKLGELRILLENTAGQGSCVGARLEELKAVLDLCPELPVGVCIDTAHLFAAGWDIRTAEGLDGALQDIDRVIGLQHVAVIHTNDSKVALGARVDRHEHIGKGQIGLEAFRRILNHGLLVGRTFILETPIDLPGDDRRNVAALWRLTGRTVRAKGKGMKPRKKAAVLTKRAVASASDGARIRKPRKR
jgi:deoxyribonuclease IV